MTGTIPTLLGQLTSLRTFYLGYAGFGNLLSGAIPTELGNLASIENIYFEDCGLTGGIPTELGLLTNLEILYLPSNQLNGSIPTELGTLTSLLQLRIDENSFVNGDGRAFPDEVCALMNEKLNTFGISYDGADGSLKSVDDCKAAQFATR